MMYMFLCIQKGNDYYFSFMLQVPEVIGFHQLPISLLGHEATKHCMRSLKNAWGRKMSKIMCLHKKEEGSLRCWLHFSLFTSSSLVFLAVYWIIRLLVLYPSFRDNSGVVWMYLLKMCKATLSEVSVKVKHHNGLLYVWDRPYVIVGHVINFLFKPENSSLFENLVSRNSTLQTK